MTWARAAVFFGSDTGSRWMKSHGYGRLVSTTLPPLFISALVQVINQPLVRVNVGLQDPKNSPPKGTSPVWGMLRHICKTRGVAALWFGTSAALMKVVPKYVVAIYVKDHLEARCPLVDKGNKSNHMLLSAKKAVTAGVAGAALTNPFDVIRNEMFKTEAGLCDTLRRLRLQGGAWPLRGCGKNLVAVAIPIASTIFLTDLFKTKL
jgi:hypothetical protein